MSVVENLVRHYSDFEVHIPHWEIADHGVTALWGPSGSGKSSVLRLLIGLEPCPGLKWRFGNEDLATLPTPARRLGVVFQNYELFPHMTARENLNFAARARGVSLDLINSLAQELSLTKFLDRPARVLSGGEAQRVALARALVGQPRVLLLDEPFASLDEDLRKDARAMVKEVIARQNVPTILVTHDREDLEALANHVVGIRDGKRCQALFCSAPSQTPQE